MAQLTLAPHLLLGLTAMQVITFVNVPLPYLPALDKGLALIVTLPLIVEMECANVPLL